MPLKLRTRGLKQVLKGLDKRVNILNNKMKPAHKAAAVVLDAWIVKNMNAEGKHHDKTSLHWPPLSERSIKEHKRVGAVPIQMLKLSGQLRQRVDFDATNEHGFVVYKTSYAADHEFGVPSRNVPQRKIFPTIKQGVTIVKPAYEHFINRFIVKPSLTK